MIMDVNQFHIGFSLSIYVLEIGSLLESKLTFGIWSVNNIMHSLLLLVSLFYYFV